MSRVLAGAVLVVGVLLSAASASADVVEVETIEIFGSPQRPSAFYVLERARHRTEVRDTRESFTDEIVRDAARLDDTSGAH